jgi:hypothetical protein
LMSHGADDHLDPVRRDPVVADAGQGQAQGSISQKLHFGRKRLR